MTGGDESANTALNIMRQWWTAHSGGTPYPGKMDLSEALNRLAMEGHAKPKSAILGLLRRGDLLAEGDFRWRKFQAGEFYWLDEGATIIRAARWQTLSDLIADEWLALSNDEWPDGKTKLAKLELTDCDIYDWQPGQNRFSTAICPPQISTWDQAYFEEWFSAWDIQVWPKTFGEEALQLDREPVPEPEPTSHKGKGGAPRKWDWDGAFLHLAALAHHGANGLFREDGGDPNQSDIARHLQAWFVDTCKNSPENSQLREYGKRFVTELNALKLRDANNPARGG